jgi:dolichol-phosphate mannosyltransferase
MTHISIVSPVYNAENIIPELVQRIVDSVTKITLDYEILLVEDGGTDNSWEIIEQVAKLNPKIKGIKLSRNFGQHYAITAGLDNCIGEWVIVMDCDLQDNPEEIVNLYSKTNAGFDIVFAKRENRNDSIYKRIQSFLFYRILSYLTGKKYDESIANFGIFHRKVIDSVLSMKENIRVFPIMVLWTGFKRSEIVVKHNHREIGRSNYNFKKASKLAMDIILAYSDKPILLVIKTGLSISALSFTFAVVTFFRWTSGLIKISGYTSLIISMFFLSGIILSTLGIIGLYVGKIFEGVKDRPNYIINKKTTDD